MGKATLQRVLALNQELASLSAAGLPMELASPTEPVTEVLQRANANLALRTSLGQSVTDALASDDQLPLVYRRAMQAGLLADSPTIVLDGVSSQLSAQDDLRGTVESSLVQPLVLATLAYFGFIFLCLGFSPSLEGVYDQLRRAPSASVAALQTARNWLPVWGPLAPLLLLATVFFWRRGKKEPIAWIPFAGRYAASLRHAALARQLATLLAHGVPLAEGLRLTGEISGDPPLVEATAALAASTEREEKLPADDPSLAALPPLLKWALTGELGDIPLPDILSFAADTYQQKAQRQAAVYHVALPVLIGALAGGAVVLLYGLCVFLPYVNLFRDLSV
jgi:type II secretory pathway component PulF